MSGASVSGWANLGDAVMAYALSRHAAKPGRDVHRCGWLAQFYQMDQAAK